MFLFLYEVSCMPIKERLFAKPCILWSPLALKCYLLVFIRSASLWQHSPNSQIFYIYWLTKPFAKRNSNLWFIQVSSLTKDCQLSKTTGRYLLPVHLLSHKPCHPLLVVPSKSAEKYFRRKKSKYIDLSAVVSAKKVFIGCWSLETKCSNLSCYGLLVISIVSYFFPNLVSIKWSLFS